MIRKLRFLLLALVAFVPAVAMPQTFEQVDFDIDTCNGIAINTAVNCEIKIPSAQPANTVQGWSTVTVTVSYTHGGGSGYQFYFQNCEDSNKSVASGCLNSTDWSPVAATATSSGTTTLTPGLVTRAVTANDKLSYTRSINYFRLRLGSLVATGSPNTSDKISVHVRAARGK